MFNNYIMVLSKIKKQKSGFTLLEMVVATAIFSIVSTICIGIYISTIKANAKISAMQKVQNEIRYMIDYMAREIRLGSVDYVFYSNDINNPIEELAIFDSSKNPIFFKNSNGYLQVKRGDSDWSDISGDNVKINSLYFYIYPEKYPIPVDSPIKQELIKIVIDVFDKNENSNMLIQTTISSRNYEQ